MSNTPKCIDCPECTMRGKTEDRYGYTGRVTYGQGKFYCTHAGVDFSNPKHYGYGKPGFLGLGTSEKTSVPSVLTSPRWCPRRKGKG